MRGPVVMTALAALLLSVPAHAEWDDFDEALQSDITSVLELRIGRYEPAIDEEFGGDGAYNAIFDGGNPLHVEAGYERQLYRGFGSAALGIAGGWARISGSAIAADGTAAPEDTRLILAPIRLSAVYRFDYLQRRFRVPLVLAFEGGFTYVLWSAKSENGVSDASDGAGGTVTGRGGTHGLHYGAGLHLLLDVFAPNMARGFDRNVGVNNSYLFAQVRRSNLNDFGDETSWDLSDTELMFGLAFEF